jgi:hypothetical protein
MCEDGQGMAALLAQETSSQVVGALYLFWHWQQRLAFTQHCATE